jgi:subtilisin family serine protease
MHLKATIFAITLSFTLFSVDATAIDPLTASAAEQAAAAAKNDRWQAHPEAYYVTAAGNTRRYAVTPNVFLLKSSGGSAGSPPDLAKLEKELRADLGRRAEIRQDETFRGTLRVSIKAAADTPATLATLRNRPDVDYLAALLVNERGQELSLSPAVVIRLSSAGDSPPPHVIATLSSYDLDLDRPLTYTDREYRFSYRGLVEDPGGLFRAARDAMALPDVEWAEPDFLVAPVKHFTPNDPLYPDQWHLHNTGQLGGQDDADIDAPEGWDQSRGAGAVIAIFDDGVETLHPDLPIWNNPGEFGSGRETNGLDDDGNGYVDDYRGWDFENNDNDPNPASSADNHGTSVAGVAAARGNNSIGVSGSAGHARILPVRSGSMLCTAWGDAMRYAARHADLVSNSWSIGGCESELDSAIADAVNGVIAGARRGAKGTPILFATGNSASGWRKFTYDITAGTYTFTWEYDKDQFVSAGYDTTWLDDITWPDGTVVDFEGATSLPSGFTTSGNADWTVVSDGIHARGATGNSAKAGSIGNRQSSALSTTRTVESGELSFWYWTSSELNGDYFDFYVDPQTGPTLNPLHYSSGQYGHSNDVAYPSSNPNAISIGASNDGSPSGAEERSYYSQFGPQLDVLAPSSGDGERITTTDRQGSAGYNAGDYTFTFGGTSSATPLAAGLVADLIAIYPYITATQVRDALRHGAEQIGPYPYVADRNDYYGHGRVSLAGSLQWLRDNNLVFDCDPWQPMIAGRWAMIGTPCLPTAPGTVASTLGDDLDTSVYGSDWYLVDKHNVGPNNYSLLTTASQLQNGRGYWIISPTGGAFLDDGELDIEGTSAAPSDISGCASANGCVVIQLNSPAAGSDYEWNLVAHPLAYPVDWADVRILVDDATPTYTPSEAETADYVSATYQAWTGSGYQPYDDTNPALFGILQPGHGIWVKTLPGAIGHSIKLLVPALPSLNTSFLDLVQPDDWYGWLTELLAPTAHADPEHTGRESAMGYVERENRRSATRMRLQTGEDWFVRLTASAPDDQLQDDGNVLGQAAGSNTGYDRYDLVELPPFAPPYLTIVFPHPDWGLHAGDYASDFRAPDDRDTWEFEIRTDSPGRQVTLCWDGPDRVIDSSVLLDVDTRQKFRLKNAHKLKGCLPVLMTDRTRRFQWQYQ